MASQYNEHTTGSELVENYADIINGKTILITGASKGGMGAMYAIAVAKAKPAMIIVAGRTHATLQETADGIAAVSPTSKTKVLDIDFGSFSSVRKAAAEVLSWSEIPAIDVLVNNAAVMAPPYQKTEDGFELQFQTNHLGPFLFTNMIMDKVMASKSPRVVWVGSDGHRFNPIRWTDYNFGNGERYNKWFAYGQSKTATSLTAVEMAKRLGPKGLRTYSLHPGVSGGTRLSRDLDWTGEAWVSFNAADVAMGTKWIANQPPYKNDEEIIATHVYASFTDDLEEYNGYYLENCHVADQYKEEVWPWAINRIEAERLWSLSEELVGQKFKH